MGIQLSSIVKNKAPWPENSFWKGDLPNLHAKIDAGIAPRISFYGDSNTAGLGAGTGYKNLVGARSKNHGVRIASAMGWQDGSFFGDQNLYGAATTQVTLSEYDPRLNLGSFINSGGNPDSCGGRLIICNGASDTPFSFFPTQPFNRVRFWYTKSGTANTSVNVLIDDISVGIINQYSATSSLSYSDFTIPKGLHDIKISSEGTGTAFIFGIETWDSESNKPRLLMHGNNGANSDTMSRFDPVYPWIGLHGLVGLNPDVVVFQCVINDIESGFTFDKSIGNYKTIQEKLSAINCDLIYCNAFSWANAKVYDGTIDKYANYMQRNAVAYKSGFCDFRYPTGGSSVIANMLGYLYSDGWHPTETGYQRKADFLKHMFID